MVVVVEVVVGGGLVVLTSSFQAEMSSNGIPGLLQSMDGFLKINNQWLKLDILSFILFGWLYESIQLH